MLTVRRRDTLHHVEGGWFSTNWNFSFDDDDPDNTWCGDLRVFNETLEQFLRDAEAATTGP